MVMVKRKTRQRRASKLGVVYYLGDYDRSNYFLLAREKGGKTTKIAAAGRDPGSGGKDIP